MAEIAEKFRFLNTQLAKEPFVYDILAEIETSKHNYLKGISNELATLDSLSKSRTIRIPFSPQRERTISYLLDQLIQNHPHETGRIISFVFKVEEQTKKLEIIEKTEYTLFMSDTEIAAIQQMRTDSSAENLLELLKNFRLFNLTKLVKKAKNRSALSNIIRTQLGVNIFTFKNFSTDKNNVELIEDFCFHKSNYDTVRTRLNLELIRKIIALHSIQINRRLSRFGILNAEVSDYRDTKLDYILNILIEDIPSSLDRKDLMEVKNFHALRGCLLKVDRLMDPVVALNNDIVNHIRECGICKTSDILAVFNTINEEILEKWASDNLESRRIFRFQDQSGEMLYIHGEEYLSRLRELYELILKKTETFNSLMEREKNEYLSLMDLLCAIGRSMTAQNSRATAVLENGNNVDEVKEIIQSFSDYKKNILLKTTLQKKKVKEQKKSLIQGFIDFIRSLFGGGGGDDVDDYDEAMQGSSQGGSSRSTARKKRPLSRESINLYERIKNLNSPLIALSDYIEIKPDNEQRIDSFITEIRDNNLKIIIPIYGAHSTLYPTRSQKVLMSDVEYLLVATDVADSPESIRNFTDSLTGYQLKDEFIPGRGIVAIEKYLLTLYRQRRAQKLKKG